MDGLRVELLQKGMVSLIFLCPNSFVFLTLKLAETVPQIRLAGWQFGSLGGVFTYNETAGEYMKDEVAAGEEYILYPNEYKYAHPGWILADKKKKKKQLNSVK